MSKRNQHVVPHHGKWAVRGTRSKQAGSIHRTQREAIKAARAAAKKQGGEMFIHGKDGQIRERNTYGKDPFPPRG